MRAPLDGSGSAFPNASMGRYGGFGGPPPTGRLRRSRQTASPAPSVDLALPKSLRYRVSAPAPVSPARLDPLEVLVALRDQEARRLASLTPQTWPTAWTRALDEPEPVPPAPRRPRMLLGY